MIEWLYSANSEEERIVVSITSVFETLGKAVLITALFPCLSGITLLRFRRENRRGCYREEGLSAPLGEANRGGDTAG